jgi:hypothetical protein
MPKTKARKRSNTQKSATKSAQAQETQRQQHIRTTSSRKNTGQVVASRMEATQGILMPAFVALGCWGLAISFFFFFPDPNHILYGSMAAAMGLIWSVIVGIRIARVTHMSREGRIYK